MTSSSAVELPMNAPLRGTVVSVQANYYWVRLEEWTGIPYPVSMLLCTRRARLKKVGQQVMVGDRVQLEEPDWEGQRAAIAAVDPRKTQLDRPPVANADQILLIFALAEPNLDVHQLTRFLVKAELTGLDVCLCLNKRDLVSAETLTSWQTRIADWGYAPVIISVRQDDTLPILTKALKDKITVVSGPSGVGKSSLINALIPKAELRVSAVSGKLGRGRHTTRHVELFELPGGGLLADTPGFNQPDIICAPETLSNCFPEIRDRLQHNACQFTDCLHRGEPGCAVSDDWERYPDYLELLNDCINQTQSVNDSADPDEAFKIKITNEGQVQREPRLQLKKHRRVSRRSRKQSLEDLRYELTDNLKNLDTLDEEDLYSDL
ncbi:small ribosomal subunit biogenesis GTPase RsgA [Oscillatoria sp. CS-180]|uniref:small ribosomal subunit biogenesis GTPase RsgA n=1 Tax=Oscillatoria sp. CS-180 TaxID=3021720 RepID=UPI0023306B9C|nr:small ribosomal subunit biogenesis GTPase RsgA [Oscillatoria sp. CS-180]MDB9524499.1 small ribosomal subunit biogenesis GTPase RsgA [Oscillatoria sp. CS-180]